MVSQYWIYWFKSLENAVSIEVIKSKIELSRNSAAYFRFIVVIVRVESDLITKDLTRHGKAREIVGDIFTLTKNDFVLTFRNKFENLARMNTLRGRSEREIFFFGRHPL